MKSLLGDIDVAKLVYGQNAMELPLNLIVQSTGIPNKYTGVFQFEYDVPTISKAIGDNPHLMILGQAIIRPRVMVATRAMVGSGAAALMTHGFMDIINAVGKPGTSVVYDITKT